MRRYLTALLLLLAALPSWAAPGSFTLTINATQVDAVTDYVTVPMSIFPAAFWTALSDISDTTGDSIRVYESDGTTAVSYYIVNINTGASTGRLMFQPGEMSTSVDADFVVKAGDSGLSVASSSSAVLGSTNYKGFWLPGMTTTDLTGNGYTLTAANSPGTATSGYEGITAADYNGSTQYHYVNTCPVSDWPLTVEAFFYADNATARMWVINTGNSTTSNHVGSIAVRGDLGGSPADPVEGYFRDRSSVNADAQTSTGFSASTWHYAAATRDGTTGTSYVYLDGGSSGSNTGTLDTITPTRVGIGALYRNTTGFYLDGRVAIAAISNVARSANYTATIDKMWDNSGFWTAGSWTADPTSGTTAWVEFTAAASTSLGGSEVTWTNPSNALTSLASAATSNILDSYYSHALDLTNVGTALDEVIGSSIDGIEVEVVATGADGGSQELYDATVQLIIGGTASGSNKAIGTQWTDASQVTRNYGGAADKWGLTPTDTQVTASNFGVRLRFESLGGATALMSVYRVRVRVTYGGGGSTANFFRFF